MSLDNMVAVLDDAAVLRKFEAAILKVAPGVIAAVPADSVDPAAQARRRFALRVLSGDGDAVTREMALRARRYLLATQPAFQTAGTAITSEAIETMVGGLVQNASAIALLNSSFGGA